MMYKICRVAIICVLIAFALSAASAREKYDRIAAARAARASRKTKVKYVRSKHGLKALMDLDSSRKKMIKELNEETDNYEKIASVMNNNELVTGKTSDSVEKEVGSPVIILPDESSGNEEWYYKPGSVSFMDGEKIRLTFDNNNQLLKWQAIPGKAPAKNT